MPLDHFYDTFSKSLPVLDKRLMERKFCGHFGFLPGFDKLMISASFQYFEKMRQPKSVIK
jgi:hypothetical protein